MKSKLLFFLALITASCVSSIPEQTAFEQLCCEFKQNPIGIETEHPQFSWVLEANNQNVSQSAYHVLVASSPDLLNNEDADLWNTGKIKSDQSTYIKYSGQPLKAYGTYFWKVKVWNQEGHFSAWSSIQSFEMGVMSQRSWEQINWIGMKEDKRTSEFKYREVQTERMSTAQKRTTYPVGYFKKDFEVTKTLAKARVYISSLGYHEIYVNGEKIGDHVLDPAPTSFDHHALYVIHDIPVDLLHNNNSVGLILSNGFYGQNIAFSAKSLVYGKPAVRMLLRLHYTDGTVDELKTDENWKVSSGPIVFDNPYAGETYDARYEMQGWSKFGYDISSWQNVAVVHPKVSKIVHQDLPAIKKTKELEPVEIFKGANGNWIVNFGQNISGWLSIQVKETKGKEITITLAEALTRNGDAIHTGSTGKFATGVDQIDKYICKGSDWEKWEPRFTYHGFQYAEIAGLTAKPTKETLKAILVHTDVVKKGNFKSSSDLLNRIYTTSEWTVIDNLHGFPEDCPHREKCGWLGDAHAVAEFCLYNYDMALFYHKFMKDIQSQLTTVKNKNTQVSFQFQVPTMVAPGKRKAGVARLDWGIAMIYLPWYHYLHTGDSSLIEQHYIELKNLISYYRTFKNENGIIANGLGDWCPPRWDRKINPKAMECHPHISANAYFYDILIQMHNMAYVLKDMEYAVRVQKEARILKDAFNQKYLQEIKGKNDFKWYGSQTATIMALRFGMVPDSVMYDVIDGLKYDIQKVHNSHHSTGIHGNRYLYTLLNDLGEEDLSYKLLTIPTFPSMTYILNCGLNTWPERQWEWDSGIEWDRSLNHPMHSGFAAYFFESLGGIRPMVSKPGYKEFEIKPTVVKDLQFIQTEIESPYGKIVSNWKKGQEKTIYDLRIPFNSTAHVVLNANDRSQIYQWNAQGNSIEVDWLECGEGKFKASLPAGEYNIEVH